MITATRYHDFSCGHRVVGHESKCAHLHGHNYRVHFTCAIEKLDAVGRVIDFSAMKSTLCEWVEDCWDHRFLAWEKDRMIKALYPLMLGDAGKEVAELLEASIVWVPFNPTAENMASFLLNRLGPAVQPLFPPGVKLIRVVVQETRKCSAEASL